MVKYTDEEVKTRFNIKSGQLSQFKKILKKHGLLGSRKPLDDTLMGLLLSAKEIRELNRLSWEEAYEIVINEYKDENGINGEDDPGKDIKNKIQAIYELYDDGTLNTHQTLEVIRKLINV